MNEWVFRPPLCLYRLNAMGQESLLRMVRWMKWHKISTKFEPWRSDAKHATSRSQRLPTMLNHHKWAGKNFVSLKLACQSGGRTRYLRLSKQAALTILHKYSKKNIYCPNPSTVGQHWNSIGWMPRVRWGRGPWVVVSTATFHARVRGSFSGFGCLKETKMFLPHPLVKIQYCGEPP